MKTRIYYTFLIILSLSITLYSFRSIKQINSRRYRLTEAQKELKNLESTNAKLKEELEEL